MREGGRLRDPRIIMREDKKDIEERIREARKERLAENLAEHDRRNRDG